MDLKYIFISGGVISGIGKGTVAASIALILKNAGYQVDIIKFENYLNIDAGTINPVEHGDVFLCHDGTEADMDIGTYEKFLGMKMGKKNFVTMGQIYKTVIEKERKFLYKGEDVEAIPHITDEIINRINALGKEKQKKIILIELGGTVGEYQNILYYEASRILKLRYPKDVAHIHVGYVPKPKHLGEPKTKPTQLSVRTLNSLGIQPDMIIARSEDMLDQKRKERFALFCNVSPDMVISNPDLETTYEVPIILAKQKLDLKIQKILGLRPKKTNLKKWQNLIKLIKKPKKYHVQVSIIGKYFGTGNYQLRDSYAALFDALDHASWYLDIKLKTNWIDAEEVEKKGINIIGKTNGVIVPIGWGERGVEGMIKAASFARQKKIPYLGLCYGMQLAVVAFARDVLGWKNAHTTEVDKKTPFPVIDLIKGQKKILKEKSYGGTMRLGAWQAKIEKNTLAYEIYKKNKVWERHRHRYEVNRKFESKLEEAGLIFSGRSVEEKLVEFIELPQKTHPFYFGTQGHPEYQSLPTKPHPVFIRFLKEAKNHSLKIE